MYVETLYFKVTKGIIILLSYDSPGFCNSDFVFLFPMLVFTLILCQIISILF